MSQQLALCATQGPAHFMVIWSYQEIIKKRFLKVKNKKEKKRKEKENKK